MEKPAFVSKRCIEANSSLFQGWRRLETCPARKGLKESFMKVLYSIVAAFLLLSSCQTIRVAPPGGLLLGQHAIEPTDQTARILIKDYTGTLKAVRFIGNGNDLELSNVVFVFDGGERQKIQNKLNLLMGALSRSIGLEEGKPNLRAIEFTYRAAGDWSGNHVEVLVYGIK
jgi:hypothetical protein